MAAPAAAAAGQQFLPSMLAVAEQYPDLKTSESFVLLLAKIADTESVILEMRMEYNRAVLNYNQIVTSIPGLAFAYIFRVVEHAMESPAESDPARDMPWALAVPAMALSLIAIALGVASSWLLDLLGPVPPGAGP